MNQNTISTITMEPELNTFTYLFCCKSFYDRWFDSWNSKILYSFRQHKRYVARFEASNQDLMSILGGRCIDSINHINELDEHGSVCHVAILLEEQTNDTGCPKLTTLSKLINSILTCTCSSSICIANKSCDRFGEAAELTVRQLMQFDEHDLMECLLEQYHRTYPKKEDIPEHLR